MVAGVGFEYWLREPDLNGRLSGYEPVLGPAPVHPAIFILLFPSCA